MALRKENTASQVPAGQFEDEMDSAIEVAGTVVTEVKEEHIAPAANTAVVAAPRAAAMVQAAPSALSTAIKQGVNGTMIKQLQNAIATEDLEAMGVGAFPRITVDLGGYKVDKEDKLGEAIAVEVLSWNYVDLITVGVQNPTAEENQMIRNSYDGVNLSGGQGTVVDYINFLKSKGYDKAQSKRYCELWANVVWSEKKGDIAPDEQCLHQVSLSPQSVQQWGRYLLESGIRKTKGIENDNVVTLTQQSKKFGSNQFAISTFAPGIKKS